MHSGALGRTPHVCWAASRPCPAPQLLPLLPACLGAWIDALCVLDNQQALPCIAAAVAAAGLLACVLVPTCTLTSHACLFPRRWSAQLPQLHVRGSEPTEHRVLQQLRRTFGPKP